jgi:hypothetical protein
MTTSELIIDPWTYFDFKKSFENRSTPNGLMLPSWVGEHARRLKSYQMLESYCRNTARAWMSHSLDPDDKANRREYGDADLLIKSVTSSVLGDSQNIHVEGEEDEDPENPGPALTQKRLLEQWASDERFAIKRHQVEQNIAKLGDGCYVLGWDSEKNRPRLRCYDPGFYFPVLDTWGDEDFPTKVHIAWEYEDPDRQNKRYIIRRTWELIRAEVPINYSYNTRPSNWWCQYSEYEWEESNLKGEVQDFDMAKAVPLVEPYNLGIDFIPVVHIPNGVSEEEHYGVSILASVLQILDDIISTDTDLQAASETTGSPVIGVQGSNLPRNEEGQVTTYGPGQVVETGDGRLDMLDTSRSLDALLKYKTDLRETLSVNSRVPRTLLGAVDPDKVNSGIILTLSFNPHSALIRELRLARQEKYKLLLKMVCRFYALNGDLTNTIINTELRFGSYLPSDRQEAIGIATQGVTNHVMSLETAVALLIEAGLPIDEAESEIARIVAQDFDNSQKMLDATGDLDAVRARHGLPPLDASLLPGNPNIPGGGTGSGQISNSPAQLPEFDLENPPEDLGPFLLGE